MGTHSLVNGAPDTGRADSRGEASRILGEAVARGFISTEELAQLLPHRLPHSRGALAQAIRRVTETLSALGVAVVSSQRELPQEVSDLQTTEMAPVPSAHHEPQIKTKTAAVADEREVEELQELKLGDDRPYLERIVDKVHAEVVRERDLLGLYLREMGRFKILPHTEVCELGRRTRVWQDVDARNRLVEHNLRLVCMVARRYRNRRLGLEYLDLIQDGNIGLIRAAELFDERKGFRFGTYAVWWIRQRIIRGICDSGDTIRIPVHMRELWGQILGASERLVQQLGREPRPDEIAAKLELSEDRVAQALRRMRMITVYLDDLVDKDGGKPQEFHEVIADRQSLTPHQLVEAKEELHKAYENIRKMFAKLFYVKKERHAAIFRMRYGLDSSLRPKTLDEVAKAFVITRERVRQITEQVWQELEATGFERDEVGLGKEFFRIRELRDLTGDTTEFRLLAADLLKDADKMPPAPVSAMERQAPTSSAPPEAPVPLPSDPKKALADVQTELRNAFAKLWFIKEPHATIFRMRYGLDGTFAPRSLEAVGAHFGFSRERAEQLVEAVWQKLRELGVTYDHPWVFQQLERVNHLRELAGMSRPVWRFGAGRPAGVQRPHTAAEPVPRRTGWQELGLWGPPPAKTTGVKAEPRRTSSVYRVLRAVSEVYRVGVGDLLRRRRTQRLAWARQVAMYLLRTDLRLSLQRVAGAMKRNHTTVLYACVKLGKLVGDNESVGEAIGEIRKRYLQ